MHLGLCRYEGDSRSGGGGNTCGGIKDGSCALSRHQRSIAVTVASVKEQVLGQLVDGGANDTAPFDDVASTYIMLLVQKGLAAGSMATTATTCTTTAKPTDATTKIEGRSPRKVTL